MSMPPGERTESDAVVAAVQRYFDALNAADLDGVLDCYTPDGLLALTQAENVQGKTGLQDVYTSTFAAVRFDATHVFDEVRVYGDEAFVRTTTDAPTTLLATGEVVQDRFREFFVVKKAQGHWRIDRYMNNRPM
ncbi:nuclear transport factor 2 family protein [Streptomyces sp. NBC_00237]|uniref:YybH family protein n=1 Tax=Streptomyces sp. NBC_00237 TaxID=2975687 RepID=UPI0022550041|nr:nuclear transport factor 2 family protein [Streptomyces sp. NBC_00237]MCX5205685.1 nuclear transport factor 2 family protein [Streptomyces sp. NBC_00237]